MPSGWEGNRKSGVALAMRHLRAQGPRKGDEMQPAYTSHGVWHTLFLLTFVDRTVHTV